MCSALLDWGESRVESTPGRSCLADVCTYFLQMGRMEQSSRRFSRITILLPPDFGQIAGESVAIFVHSRHVLPGNRWIFERNLCHFLA